MHISQALSDNEVECVNVHLPLPANSDINVPGICLWIAEM